MNIRTCWGMVMLFGALLLVSSCAAPHFFTVTIYESPNRVVKLQAVPDANHGKGFSHPVDIDQEQLSAAMRGLQVEIHNAALSIPFLGGSNTPGRRRAFSDNEIKFFAPLFAKGLAQATPEELITFYENAEVSDQYELTTSGGLYVKGEEIHFLISNFGVKTRIWQDNEQYEAPYHLRPMEPMDPQPGRLVFEHSQLMVEPQRGILNIGLTAEPWEVGVRWKELK
ncbi:hypothetical protein [Candidatus Nitronereus thalassa]|uniref:Lipoprotein n=1 Tax=Candidatus Nitronereus thalassa TaxID=3020898 RepID=A0ABU3K9Z6_9BACT|nr:hypothetical protein [Candidatus Nitronereus thalassa]MDT7043192.1 hypothetical protein [Candidatus Nitronereus thalassa]